ncbi:MAG: type II toxin-antitoxin system PemK/MazF family toxin [Acidimicrobiia bacterium]
MTRGDVHELRLRRGVGHEQHGRRFGVVIQTDELSVLSTVLVAPTSTQARGVWWRPEISVAGERTRVLTDQTRAIDPTRLGRRVGHLTAEETWALDDALRAVLATG